jgi:hypothetical protein
MDLIYRIGTVGLHLGVCQGGEGFDGKRDNSIWNVVRRSR